MPTPRLTPSLVLLTTPFLATASASPHTTALASSGNAAGRAPRAVLAPADASCTPGAGWLCGISASSPGRAAAPRAGGARGERPAPGGSRGDTITPMCAPTGGADHCITVSVPAPARTPTAAVAEMARDAIALPPPRPRTSPRGRTWVRFPTHLWIDGASWRTRSASVAVDGQTVTITGRPTHVTWDLGETTLTCDGPGVPYTRRATGASCAHAFARATPGPFTVTATVHYAVAWTCRGACDAPGGSFDPLPASGTVALRVSEIQTGTTP